MVLSLLVFVLGFTAGGLASFVGTVAGPIAADVLLLGAAAGLAVVRPPSGARVAAFPPGTAAVLGALALAAAGAAVALPLEIAALPIVIAGVVLGRSVQAAAFWLGVQGVPRRPPTALLVLGAVAAPFVVTRAGEQSTGLAAAVLGASAALFALLARSRAGASFDLPKPRPEPPFAGLPTLVAVLVAGAGFARVVDGPPPSLLWVGAGAALGAVVAPRARRSGVVLGTCALVSVGFLGIALDHAPDSPRLADSAVRAAVASVLLGLGVVGLPRLYATLPPASKVVARLSEGDRPVLDGAVRRIALFTVGLAVGRAPWFDDAAPRLVFVLLALAGAALVWFDPRAGIGRKAKVVAVAGAMAGVGIAAVWGVG
ncbi:MAG: hypothetical protein ACF8XB_03420 [Planctomycetota bacterium JB042]